jgi:parallel beta-helix repeat protein
MQVTGNTLNNVQGGVLVVDSDNTNITGNTFNNNQAAVGLYCGNNNSIDGNIFQNNDAVLEVDSTGCDPMLGTNMNGNDMVDNGVIVNNTGTSVIDATNNYIDPKPKPSAIGTGAPFVLFDPQSPTPFFLSLNRQIPGGPAGPVVLLPCTNNPDFAVFIIDQNKDFDIYRINGNQGLGLKRYAGLELNDFQSRNQNRTPALLGSLLPQNINALFAGRNEDFKTFYIGNNQWRFELRVNGALVRSDICTRR